MANIDSALALTVALFVNAAILIVAAAVFNRQRPVRCRGHPGRLQAAQPAGGRGGREHAVCRCAAGQWAELLDHRHAGRAGGDGGLHPPEGSPWLRRIITRSLAIIPTIIVVAVTGEEGTEKLLIFSQVILSLQLSFAVVPLVLFTGNKKIMGEFVNARWLKALAWFVAVLIAGLNGWLLVLMAQGRT
jgi:manganese transport protein